MHRQAQQTCVATWAASGWKRADGPQSLQMLSHAPMGPRAFRCRLRSLRWCGQPWPSPVVGGPLLCWVPCGRRLPPLPRPQQRRGVAELRHAADPRHQQQQKQRRRLGPARRARAHQPHEARPRLAQCAYLPSMAARGDAVEDGKNGAARPSRVRRAASRLRTPLNEPPMASSGRCAKKAHRAQSHELAVASHGRCHF